MNLERSLEELRNEPVPASALPDALSKLRGPHPRRPLWLVPTVMTSLAVLAALWPKAHSDEAWASALKNLREAKYIHIVFRKRYETVEAWKAGDKMRLLSGTGEMRYNGTEVSRREGFLTSVRKQTLHSPFAAGDMELGAFTRAEDEIESKRVAPKAVIVSGLQYNAYKFIFARVTGTLPPPQNRNYRGSELGYQTVTAYVDPQANRIVELDKAMEFAAQFPKRMWDAFQIDSFKATVDYPSTLDEAMFEPPADAFDFNATKGQVTKLLAGSLGIQQVAGQKVDLKALLCDGVNLYAVWEGCPAEFDSPSRFEVDGVDYGPRSKMAFAPIRCFSSAKCRRPASAANPYCVMAEGLSKRPPDKVNLTLPVFVPDTQHPYLSENHRLQGYHSRMVGTAVFHSVPVTPINPIDFYERQFGLLNNCW